MPNVTTIDLNEALRVYLGSDSNGGITPYGMAERLAARYRDKAEAIQSSIDQDLDGLLDVPTSKLSEPLENVRAFVETRTRELRPDLADDVCKAIGNYAAYQWR